MRQAARGPSKRRESGRLGGLFQWYDEEDQDKEKGEGKGEEEKEEEEEEVRGREDKQPNRSSEEEALEEEEGNEEGERIESVIKEKKGHLTAWKPRKPVRSLRKIASGMPAESFTCFYTCDRILRENVLFFRCSDQPAHQGSIRHNQWGMA